MAVFVTNKGTSRTDPAWQDLDEINGAANKGVRLAADSTDEKAQVLSDKEALMAATNS